MEELGWHLSYGPKQGGVWEDLDIFLNLCKEVFKLIAQPKIYRNVVFDSGNSTFAVEELRKPYVLRRSATRFDPATLVPAADDQGEPLVHAGTTARRG
jgi:hypothetical protein